MLGDPDGSLWPVDPLVQMQSVCVKSYVPSPYWPPLCPCPGPAQRELLPGVVPRCLLILHDCSKIENNLALFLIKITNIHSILCVCMCVCVWDVSIVHTNTYTRVWVSALQNICRVQRRTLNTLSCDSLSHSLRTESLPDPSARHTQVPVLTKQEASYPTELSPQVC